jgi:transcriptional regulator with XRE-family HTH domain
METYDDIAKSIRAARALLGLRQDELAERANVSRQMVARLEKAEKGVKIETYEKIRSALAREGVEFLPESDTLGPGVALRKRAQKSKP